MFNKILVPLDGSELAEEVLPFLHELADENEDEIVLLRVVEYPLSLYLPYYEYPPFDPDNVQTIMKGKAAISRDVAAHLERTASTIAASGIKVTTEICDGAVVDSILGCIERLRIDLVVLSAYGQGGGMQGMIGSVANRVLHESPVPVVLVRPVSSFVTRSINELPRAV